VTTKFVYAGDMIEANGKSVRENNQMLQHTIPCGAIVREVNSGLVCYVATQDRDCDGTPVYGLTIRPEMVNATEPLHPAGDDPFLKMMYQIARGQWQMGIDRGYAEGDLVVERNPTPHEIAKFGEFNQ